VEAVKVGKRGAIVVPVKLAKLEAQSVMIAWAVSHGFIVDRSREEAMACSGG